MDITLKSDGAKQFEWPKVSANRYTLPLWEGKRIPADDPYWKEFLKDEEFSFIESFSMRFFALDKSKYSIVYIADNMFNDTIHFNTDDNIQFSFTHEFPTINPNKEYGFRLYVTDSDPTQIAQVYKNYIKEKGEFKTLTEKAKEIEHQKAVRCSAYVLVESGCNYSREYSLESIEESAGRTVYRLDGTIAEANRRRLYRV